MNPKYKKILFISLAILSIGSLLVSLFAPTMPKLVSSVPPSSGNLVDPNLPVTLKFDRKIDVNNFTFTIIPSETLNPTLLDPNTIQVSFSKPLRINTEYTLSISFKERLLTQLLFTTKVPQTTQYDARFNQDIQNEQDAEYPLLAKTPYDTAEYRVVYSAIMTLEITLKNSNLTSQDATNEVKEWVRNNGGNVDEHKYIIVD